MYEDPAVFKRLLLTAILVGLAATAGAVARGGSAVATCAPLPYDPAYVDGVRSALAQGQDAWGNALLAAPGGPSYDGVRALLHPLLMVGKPAGLKPRRLTDSGVYYLAFGQPRDDDGAGVVQLHVADGSQIVSRRVDGSKLTVFVGTRGKERYGSCLSRLETPRLAQGYLPILDTAYTDAHGTRYRQESFAARIPQTRSLVSFVRLSVDPSGTRGEIARVRLTPSVPLRRVRHQLRHKRLARLLFGKNARFDGRSLVYTVRKPRVLYLAWLDHASRTRPLVLDRATYERARATLEAYWAKRLAAGAELVVPEQRVDDAERNLLIQNLLLSWRYSLGNAYAHFSWELTDVAEVMGAYGYPGIEQAIMKAALRAQTVFPNRAAGQRMAGAADYFRRYGDTNFVERVTPRFRKDVESFGRELDSASALSLLPRERYGADIAGPIYGLHAQALALQGLRGIADVWTRTGRPQLAAEATAAADRLETGLRAAVATAEVPMGDGSVFIPIALVDGQEKPYDSLTTSKRGSYWNLVMPYALASGLIRPGSAEASGVLRYLFNHGSRFLGLVRFSPHTGVTNPGYQTPGTDDVYGTNLVRFLADNDQPDQLVLSLYGKLGAGMTENTFVSGEGSTIAPDGNRYYRSMHRPPNSANNAFFLETLRLLLVHETNDANGLPRGLELAYSTPRAWLEPGKEIAVRRLQTSFGQLSYTLDADAYSVRASIDLPSGFTGPLRLRLRLPAGQRLGAVLVNGKPYTRLAGSETIDLTGLTGHVDLVAGRVL
jgi:hypothetical protein